MLASYKWIRESGEDETFWKSFFKRMKEKPVPFQKDLVRVLAEIWMASGSREEEMLFVEDELLQAMEENGDEQLAFRKAFKLTRAMHELMAMDTMERKRIIEHLRSLGPDMHDAVPELLSVLLDKDREIESRQSACLVLDSYRALTESNSLGLGRVLSDTEEYLFLREEILPWFKEWETSPSELATKENPLKDQKEFGSYWCHRIRTVLERKG